MARRVESAHEWKDWADFTAETGEGCCKEGDGELGF